MSQPEYYPSLRRHASTGHATQLTNDQWFLIADHFDWQPPSRAGGRPPTPPRAVFEALLWMLRNGGPGKDFPKSFPSESTCRRRLRKWAESGVLTQIWSQLIELSDELGWVDWDQLIADGTFCRARKGGMWSASAGRAKGPRLSC